MLESIILLACMVGSQAFLDIPCNLGPNLCNDHSLPKLGINYDGANMACNEVKHIGDVTSQPKITFSGGTENQQYALVYFDPDAPYPCAHPDGSSFLHYAAVVKQVNGELTPVHTLASYKGPHPPMAVHRYQFYLYPWSSSQNPRLHQSSRSRSGFKLDVFKQENNFNKPTAFFQLRVPSAKSLIG